MVESSVSDPYFWGWVYLKMRVLKIIPQNIGSYLFFFCRQRVGGDLVHFSFIHFYWQFFRPSPLALAWCMLEFTTFAWPEALSSCRTSQSDTRGKWGRGCWPARSKRDLQRCSVTLASSGNSPCYSCAGTHVGLILTIKQTFVFVLWRFFRKTLSVHVSSLDTKIHVMYTSFSKWKSSIIGITTI